MLAILLSRRQPALPITVLACSLLSVGLVAQEPDPPGTGPEPAPPEPEAAAPQEPKAAERPPGRRGPREADLGRVVITASRDEQTEFEASYSTSVIDSVDILQRQYRTTPQALRDIPGIMVQETSTGHGSPYIRGFTSFRNLFLVDGIRLNNSVFRSGPNQYWNTVDPFSLDRIEVVKGPHSVLFGSDAVGGTVQAITMSPTYRGEGLNYGGRSFLRYASADNSVIGRGQVDIGYGSDDGSWTGALIGGTVKRFDDLEAGEGTGEQPYTAYSENDFDAKVVHRFNEKVSLVAMHQRVEQSDVPRTHRTVFANRWRGTGGGSDLIREFDQRRYLSYLQLHAVDLEGFVDEVHVSASVHEQKETRERTLGDGRQRLDGFDVDSYGLWAQFVSDSKLGRWTYGAEWYRDKVQSFTADPNDPTRRLQAIQGPVGDDATYDLFAVFVQDQIDVDERLSFTLGGRFNYAAADIDSVRDPVTGDQIAIDESWSDFVFSARGRYEVIEDRLAVFGGVSQGFRAPNLTDLSRFDDARSNEFEIPAPNVDPEFYTQYEIGVKVQDERGALQASYFYTSIRDQILRSLTGEQRGDDFVVTKTNVGDGHVQGVEFGGALNLTDALSLFGNFTWIEGRTLNFRGQPTNGQAPELAGTYLTRLMPITYQVGLRYDDVVHDRFWVETRLIRAEDADKLSDSDIRDTSRIPAGGTPSYLLWDFGAGYRISDATNAVFRFENITDEDYRVHGSGQNRPGRNLIFAVETEF